MCDYGPGATVSVPTVGDDGGIASSSSASTSSSTSTTLSPPPEAEVADTNRKLDVYLMRCEGAKVTVTQKMKAVKLEKCMRCEIHVPTGAVGTIELVSCRRTVVHLGAPCAGIKLDECSDISVHASWEAREGFIDDSAETAAAGSGVSAPVGTGLHIISSGCHGVTLRYPSSKEVGARMMEKLIPDTLYTILNAEEEWPSTTVVSAGSWGRNKETVRKPTTTSNHQNHETRHEHTGPQL